MMMTSYMGQTPFWSGPRCDAHARQSIIIVILQREKKSNGGSKLEAALKSLVSRDLSLDFLGAGGVPVFVTLSSSVPRHPTPHGPRRAGITRLSPFQPPR